jgi:hypothetical protein
LRSSGPEIDGELGLDAQQIAPLHRPIDGKLTALKKLIYKRSAPPGIGAGEKRRRLLRRGQRADGVKVGAAEKNLV